MEGWRRQGWRSTELSGDISPERPWLWSVPGRLQTPILLPTTPTLASPSSLVCWRPCLPRSRAPMLGSTSPRLAGDSHLRPHPLEVEQWACVGRSLNSSANVTGTVLSGSLERSEVKARLTEGVWEAFSHIYAGSVRGTGIAVPAPRYSATSLGTRPYPSLTSPSQL